MAKTLKSTLQRAALLVASTLASTGVALAEPASHTKVYLCRIEHSAGLVRNTNGERRPDETYSGQVQQPSDRTDFQLELSPYVLDPITRQLCQKTIARYQQILASAPNISDPQLRLGLFSNNNFYRECLATRTIVVTYPFAKDQPGFPDRWLFRGGDYADFIGVDLWQWLNLYGQDGDHPTFDMGIPYDAGPVVVDGKCSRVAR